MAVSDQLHISATWPLEKVTHKMTVEENAGGDKGTEKAEE
jgi:hypothetical protein